MASRDVQVHRGGETVLLQLYERGGGDWRQLAPLLIGRLLPDDSDAVPFQRTILGIPDDSPRSRRSFDRTRSLLETWWDTHGSTFDPVLGALDSIRDGSCGEPLGFLEHRFLDASPLPIRVDPANDASESQIRAWRSWCESNLDYFWYDPDELAWRIDEEAKAQGIPTSRR